MNKIVRIIAAEKRPVSQSQFQRNDIIFNPCNEEGSPPFKAVVINCAVADTSL